MYGNAIFTRSVQVSLVDMLYLGVFLSNYDYYAEQMNRSWKNIQDMIYWKSGKGLLNIDNIVVEKLQGENHSEGIILLYCDFFVVKEIL